MISTLKARLPHVHWPPSITAVAVVLLIGLALLTVAIAMRRKSILAIAVLWNAVIVIAFMSPFNRHVFHLATHQQSVVVNALAGVVWLSLCAVAVAKS